MDVTSITPKYKIRLFNTQFNPEDCSVSDLLVIPDNSRLGWYELSPDLVEIEELTVNSRIQNGSIGSLRFSDNYKYLYTAGLITKAIYSNQNTASCINQPVSTGTKLLFYVDDFKEDIDCSCTITISGTNDSDTAITEDFVIQSTETTFTESGTFVFNNPFKQIDTDGIDVSGLPTGCTLTLFGDIGTEVLRREIQILCDTNDDGYYGLMFGGVLSILPSKHRYNYTTYTGKLFGYTEYTKNCEYVCGNRTKYRCANYSQTGEKGVCSASSVDGSDAKANWQTNCFTGDYHPSHPPFGDFTITDVPPQQYTCEDYVASDVLLPFDGYPYHEDYYNTDSNYYKPHPYDYFDTMLALQIYLNNTETHKVRSNDYKLFSVASGVLVTDITSGATTFDIENADYYFNFDETADYIAICEKDLMEVTSISGTGSTRTLGVTRDVKNVISQSHTAGTWVYILEAGNITTGMADRNNTLLTEPVYTSTAYRTGNSIADNLSYRFEDEEVIFWIDDFKQLHLNVFYGENLGYDSTLVFSETDTDYPILKVVDLQESDVVNKVVMDVDINGTVYRCQLRAEDVSTRYGESVTLFGERIGDLEYELVNGVGASSPAAGIVGFADNAVRYLKKHSFPRYKQTLRFFGFIPSEHAYSFVSPTFPPRLKYTDTYNGHVDLRGHKVTAPDYHFDARPNETFIIEDVKYVAKGYGVLYTDITMSRLTTPTDYGY